MTRIAPKQTEPGLYGCGTGFLQAAVFHLRMMQARPIKAFNSYDPDGSRAIDLFDSVYP